MTKSGSKPPLLLQHPLFWTSDLLRSVVLGDVNSKWPLRTVRCVLLWDRTTFSGTLAPPSVVWNLWPCSKACFPLPFLFLSLWAASQNSPARWRGLIFDSVPSDLLLPGCQSDEPGRCDCVAVRNTSSTWTQQELDHVFLGLFTPVMTAAPATAVIFHHPHLGKPGYWNRFQQTISCFGHICADPLFAVF